ncbi:M23 family metallopeptidase [Edaphobacillus lindanitolerans]|uniref:Peptidase family M23 n=1 Tax=Edaphobacillus lindanitolerans TaxID=550447 RepID=A0A1U7PL59_9BACI|nr:M23 family metallopeptidase [Edaphobacillus lindanitolerans]SIT87283.1 Peptidase family M23 [Edaphobacillus lindanitolerans]
MRHALWLPAYLIILSFVMYALVSAEGRDSGKAAEISLAEERTSLYMTYETPSVPWHLLAAVDRYERNIQRVRNDLEEVEGMIAFRFPDEFWRGAPNPETGDSDPAAIEFFSGGGLDGNGDGKADPNDPEDILFTLALSLGEHGGDDQAHRLALWGLYGNEEAVRQVMTISELFRQFGTIELDEHVFPLPKTHHYTYNGTWGAKRGWGGRRMHEGTDLFASYGVPVRSVTYGVIEMKGWNEFGGWRVGIRDAHNVYHYFAHLASFEKGLEQGQIVEPGTVIGYVGSSGYGKEGTAGKFPPHLHYGMYKFDGRSEWAFDPYPSLLRWEKEGK